jgi:hypothetical protein
MCFFPLKNTIPTNQMMWVSTKLQML